MSAAVPEVGSLLEHADLVLLDASLESEPPCEANWQDTGRCDRPAVYLATSTCCGRSNYACRPCVDRSDAEIKELIARGMKLQCIACKTPIERDWSSWHTLVPVKP